MEASWFTVLAEKSSWKKEAPKGRKERRRTASEQYVNGGGAGRQISQRVCVCVSGGGAKVVSAGYF